MEGIIDRALTLKNEHIVNDYNLEALRKVAVKVQMIFHSTEIPTLIAENSIILNQQGRVITGVFTNLSKDLIIQLPKGKLSHIQKHNIQSLKNQAQYLSDKQLKLKLQNSFFSPKWSKEKINKNVEIAYNELLKKGKRGDTFPYKIDGETIKI